LYFAPQKQHVLGYWALQTLFYVVALFARIFSVLFFKCGLNIAGQVLSIDVTISLHLVTLFTSGNVERLIISYGTTALLLIYTAFPRGVRMAGFSQNPFCAAYFFATAKKSRSPNYVLHPIISDI
jgi:hypothetical protein